MIPQDIEILIRESTLTEADQQELIELYAKSGDTEEFRARLDTMLGSSIDKIAAETQAAFDQIDADIAPIDARIAAKETALAEELKEKIKLIDPWDMKKKAELFAAYERDMENLLTDAKAEVDTYLARKILN